MTIAVVSVTRKGQATIPKRMREKLGIRDRVMVVETAEGVLLKPLPKPEDEFGSLREMFKGKTARELLAEARTEDEKREKELRDRV